MQQEHTLKVLAPYFDPLRSGEKTFEVRRDDRGFQKGDILVLQRWDQAGVRFTGMAVKKEVTYILTGGQFGIESGYVIMGLKNV